MKRKNLKKPKYFLFEKPLFLRIIMSNNNTKGAPPHLSSYYALRGAGFGRAIQR